MSAARLFEAPAAQSQRVVGKDGPVVMSGAGVISYGMSGA